MGESVPGDGECQVTLDKHQACKLSQWIPPTNWALKQECGARSLFGMWAREACEGVGKGDRGASEWVSTVTTGVDPLGPAERLRGTWSVYCPIPGSMA